MMSAPVDWIVDMDLARFFDTMPHTEILAVLAERIADQTISTADCSDAQSGCADARGRRARRTGQPPRLHRLPCHRQCLPGYVLDQWFATTVTQHCRGYCVILRYADDALALFEREDDAHRFLRVLAVTAGQIRLTPQSTEDAAACGWQTPCLARREDEAAPAHL